MTPSPPRLKLAFLLAVIVFAALWGLVILEWVL